jgi:hypothetical protein
LVDLDRKSAGCKVLEGKKNTAVVISQEETKRIQQEARIAGRKNQANKQVKINEEVCPLSKTIDYSGIKLRQNLFIRRAL